jgi:hypothetical protein
MVDGYSLYTLEEKIKKFPGGIFLVDLVAMFNANYTKKDIAIVSSILKYSTKIEVKYQKTNGRVITKLVYDTSKLI